MAENVLTSVLGLTDGAGQDIVEVNMHETAIANMGLKLLKLHPPLNVKVIDETVHKPEIMSCAVKVHGPRGEMRPKGGGSSECSKQKDFYGNFQVSQITTSPMFEFKVSISSQRPAWIVSHMFGITDASVIFIKKAVNVFEVSDSSGAYLTVGTKPVNGTQKIVQPNVDSMHLNLPYKDHPVLYAVHLEVKDIADNIKQARRFVLYDNSSTIVFNESVPLLVSSAGSKSQHVWQTNHGKLCFLWKGRYYNNKYIHSNLLKPINAAPHGMINGLYEQNTGLLPVTGTVNIHGITGFMYTLSKGDSVIFQNKTVPNFTSQHICLSPTVNDGETFYFQLTAIDIMDNTFDDEIDVHIDASIPEVENVWLVRDGYERLFVHNSTDLSKMILQFDAFDPHSGIFTVKWGIGTTGGGMELGHGSLGVIKHNDSCVSSENCYCPAVGLCEQSNYTLSLNSLVHNNTHIGNHNREYFFTITVTNMAHLVTVEHLDILVDDSPPVEGVVQEGPIDGPDIDYTSLDQVIVHWHGFIDHESGTKLYRVGIAKNCLTGQQFMDGIKNFTDLFVTETTEQSIIVPLSSEGKHFITVVAYNNAMEPSKPVCSDGIVLDKTSPKIENISLTNARVAETVACSNNTAWFVHENVTRIKLADVPSCRRRCQGSKFDPLLMSLPEEIIVSRDDEISAFMCNRLARYNNTQIYIPTDTLDLNWDIREDFSQIRNVFVGFGTNLGSKGMPDIVGYQNAKHKRWFRDQHPALSSGTNMYIFIKVMNKAGLTSIATYGPVLIDETPPICPTTIEARVSEQDVILQWNQSTFYDREQREQIGSIFFRIGHMYKFVTPFLQWKINESPNCTDLQGHCILYPVHRLQYYDTELSLPFSFELHVYNYAGHYCSVKSKQFSLPSKFPPGHGVVYDIDPRKDTNDKRTTDTDYTTTANKFCVSWTGFWHHKDVTFKSMVENIEVYSCANDLDFQTSSEIVEIHWTIDANLNDSSTCATLKTVDVGVSQHALISELNLSPGSYPGGQDVVMFTNAGLSEGVVHRNITLTPGNAYYGTVTSVSQGVIFDNSPPIKGMVHVGGILVHSYVTSKGSLSIHWMNFKDPESGISKFEVGIGSNTYSTDVKALAHVNGDFTLFPKDGMHDGLKYYVTMKFDLDYQLDVISLSCHWTDFVDPHSLMLYYRVGLGTSPGETDVFPFYNVALRKDPHYKHNG
ncbi:hypothetical protein KUTeg_010341 [Tegillarca granosa]|uniref:Uncharacterized protein n=1 Tax=Tegillarca granosa TaxID=220873 RepID=A0ABQ9F6G8_TEGGR|nr:hypothetical protein KUTeg_010341 [Tegillarca granosa]